MNFEEIQMIWDAQKNETLYAVDKDALRRLVEKDSAAINRDLKALEFAAITVLIGLGVATLIDTFFNGDEYFQLAGVAFDGIAAGYLWLRRRKRESGLQDEPASLLDRIETAMKQARSTIQCGRDMAIVFSLFALYGVGIRMLIYGWRGSEIKLAVAILCVALLFAWMKFSEKTTHSPRLRNLDALRAKLLDV
jgi:hypothetical protein